MSYDLDITEEQYRKFLKDQKDIIYLMQMEEYMKEKKESNLLVSPKGLALYPFITITDTKYHPDGIYRVDLLLDPENNENDKEFLGMLKSKMPKKRDRFELHAPFRTHIDLETDQPTGKWVVHFASKYQPRQFDSKGTKIENDDKVMANNSIIKVSFIPNIYKGIAGKDGLNLYLQAIQIFEFKEWHGANADYYGFEEEGDGYIVEKNEGEEFKNEKLDEYEKKEQGLEENNKPEDDLPF